MSADALPYRYGLHYWGGSLRCAHCLRPVATLEECQAEDRGPGWLCLVCWVLVRLDIALREAIPPGCRYPAGSVNVPDPRPSRRPKRGRANLVGCREAEGLKPI